MNNFVSRFAIYFVSLFIYSVYGQSKISLIIENDSPFGDAGYTFGHGIAYQKKIDKNQVVFNKYKINSYRFELKNEVFTPVNLDAEDTSFFDRPFASFSGITTSLSASNKDTYLKGIAVLGVTGSISGGNGFQKWYHSNFVEKYTLIPSNVDPIANSFHANTNLFFAKNIVEVNDWLGKSLYLNGTMALGTKDVFSEIGIGTTIGKRSNFSSSTLFNEIPKIAKENELFFYANIKYRYVLHDATLQGNIFGDSSNFTVEPDNNILLTEVGFSGRFNKHEVRFSHNYFTKKSSLERNHNYLSLTYGYLVGI